MHFKNLTFNDLPTVVGELCKRIENLETVLKNSLADFQFSYIIQIGRAHV